MFSLVKQLKNKGLKIALLSNTEIPVMNHIKKQNWPDFSVFVYSCEVGMRKPDEEIYKYTLEKLAVKPEEAVFVDDKQENIDTANKLGIKGILFNSADELLEKLKNKIVFV